MKGSSAAPELPTIAESGYPGFNYTSWGGLFAPEIPKWTKVISDSGIKPE